MDCKCGMPMTEKKETMDHQVFQTRVTLVDMPYYVCEPCNRRSYGKREQHVARLLEHAYVEGKAKIYYKE